MLRAEQLAIRLSEKKQKEPNLKLLTINDIQKVAKNQQATLVTYSVIQDAQKREKELYIWVVNPKGEIKFKRQELPKQSPDANKNQGLTNLVTALRNNVLRGTKIDSTNALNTAGAYQLILGRSFFLILTLCPLCLCGSILLLSVYSVSNKVKKLCHSTGYKQGATTPKTSYMNY